MPGIGTIVNVLTVAAGTAVGLLFGGLIPERMRDSTFRAIGLTTFVIGISMALGGMKAMGEAGGMLGRYAALVMVGSMVMGTILGEALRIEHWLEQFGHWLQSVAHRIPWLAPAAKAVDGDDEVLEGHTLVEGFVTASLLYCVGAMTVLGSIQDGLGNPSTLYLKATLDGFASVALASTLGVGVGLSVIPVAVIQGGIALVAAGFGGEVSPEVISAIEAVGGVLICAIGLDLTGIKRLAVGNMLPAIFVAMGLAAWLA